MKPNKADKADMMCLLLGYVSAEWLTPETAFYVAKFYELV